MAAKVVMAAIKRQQNSVNNAPLKSPARFDLAGLFRGTLPRLFVGDPAKYTPAKRHFIGVLKITTDGNTTGNRRYFKLERT